MRGLSRHIYIWTHPQLYTSGVKIMDGDRKPGPASHKTPGGLQGAVPGSVGRVGPVLAAVLVRRGAQLMLRPGDRDRLVPMRRHATSRI